MRRRHLDLLGVLALLFIGVSLAASLMTDNPVFVLIKGSVLSGAISLACFGSLLLPRPAMFYVARYFFSAGDTARAGRFDEMWRFPRFRGTMRFMTVVWGAAHAAEALLRVGFLLWLPVSVFLLASKLMGIGVTVGLIAWSALYARRVQAAGAGARGAP